MLIEKQNNIDSFISSTTKKVWLIAKRSRKYSLSLISERLKLDINKIVKTLSEVGFEITPDSEINEEQLDFLCERYAVDSHNFKGFDFSSLHTLIAHVCALQETRYRESNLIFHNLSKVVNFKIRNTELRYGHERFFRNQDIFLSRPSKDSPVEKCVNSVINIFEDVLKGKNIWQKENKDNFSCEDNYDYFKQSDLQTIERDTLTKYRQLKNLLKRIIKEVKSKVSPPLVTIFLKRIIPLNIFHTYTTDEDDINRVATNTFSFSKISIYQLREAVFHSINSKTLIKNEIRFGGIS